MARKIAVCDAETDPFVFGRIPQPFLWGYFDGKLYREFTETEKLVEFLKEQNVICYAHNGGRFDWHFLLPYFHPYDEIMLINGRIAKVYLGMAELRDSVNIFPVALEEYKKDKIDYAIFEKKERNKPKNRQLISDYLRSDCVYLHELVTRFVADYGMCLTQAGASMKAWKKISQRPIPHTDKDFYEYFAPYYYGGRVQCFEKGIIDVAFTVYDINSAYPYAMLHNHPYSEDYDICNGYREGAHFYKVECESTGAFPFREPDGLSFPADGKIREFYISAWEFDTAFCLGQVDAQNVIESVTFSETVDFADYINHFYTERLKAKRENDAAGSLFSKLFMNSLYGKFAANPDNYHSYMIVPLNVISGVKGLESDGKTWNFAGEIGPWGLAQAELDEHEKRFYNVATGASITGFVRAMLWKTICASDRVLYCDTDSIAVVGKCNVKTSDKLGDWKPEGNFDRAGIAGKKLYIFRNVDGSHKMASKGARLTVAQMWKVASGEIVTHNPDAPTFSVKRSPTFVSRKLQKT